MLHVPIVIRSYRFVPPSQPVHLITAGRQVFSVPVVTRSDPPRSHYVKVVHDSPQNTLLAFVCDGHARAVLRTLHAPSSSLRAGATGATAGATLPACEPAAVSELALVHTTLDAICEEAERLRMPLLVILNGQCELLLHSRDRRIVCAGGADYDVYYRPAHALTSLTLHPRRSSHS